MDCIKVEGSSTIELGTTVITGVKFRTDIPHDSNARSTDMGSTVTITGKILTAVDGDPFDGTRQLGLWARGAGRKIRLLPEGQRGSNCSFSGCTKIYIPECFCGGLSGRLWRCGRSWNLYSDHQAEEG